MKKCDAVLPLVAIANPAQYVKHPLRVFELDFEANLEIVRNCAKYNKRMIFPSTSEIYGMCRTRSSMRRQVRSSTARSTDSAGSTRLEADARSRHLCLRCARQPHYTLFRPFNWIGPNLDDVEEPKEGSSRLFTQFISNVIFKKPLQLVDGGGQGRSFTFIDDGVEALLTIIENKDERATSPQFSTSATRATASPSAMLAERTIRIAQEFPVLRENAKATQIVDLSAGNYFGKYYQDIQLRVPAIEAAKRDLGWAPKTDMDTAIRRTIDYYVKQENFGARAAALSLSKS